MLSLRRSEDRGHVAMGWLDTYHTFSFGEYFDRQHMAFGPLRVINEDRIAGNQGFPSHPHRDMEILTYLLAGQLAHKDSMGNTETIRPGELQRMTAGTGVVHSEFNPQSASTHLLQIWLFPNRKGLAPGYEQKSFSDQIAKNAAHDRLTLVASQIPREGSLTIHQDADVWIGRMKAGSASRFSILPGRIQWLQLIEGDIEVGNLQLKAGDGAAVRNEKEILIKTGQSGSHFILFDMANEASAG